MECLPTTDVRQEPAWLDPPYVEKAENSYGAWLPGSKQPDTDPRGSVFDRLPTPALLVAANGLIVESNQALGTLLDRDTAALVGKPYWRLLSPVKPTAESKEPMLHLLHAGGGDRPVALRRVQLTSSPGAPLLLLLEDAPVSGSGAPAGGPSVLDVAHELRSLLLSFNLGLGLLAQQETYEGTEERRLVASLRHTAVDLQTLLENLLDAASIGASRLSVVRQEMDLAGVLQEAILVVEPLLGSSGQQIVADLPAEELLLEGDAQRLRQVLVNLLHNAIKYGARDEPIVVRAIPAAGVIRIEVSDRGPGIPADEQPFLFNRFYRGRTVRKAQQGTGLGLAIARAVVRGHGGEIGVHSTPGEGTTFWFTLPTA